MSIKNVAKMALLFIVTCSCAPSEQEMSSLRDNGGSLEGRRNPTDLVDYGGAQIGSSVLRANAQSCIESGKFFDRKATKPTCTIVELARIVCREEAIKQSMDDAHRGQFEKLAKSKLAGYLLDQCIDCAAKNSRKTCRENADKSDIKSGTLLTFVKDLDGRIDVQVLFVPQ